MSEPIRRPRPRSSATRWAAWQRDAYYSSVQEGLKLLHEIGPGRYDHDERPDQLNRLGAHSRDIRNEFMVEYCMQVLGVCPSDVSVCWRCAILFLPGEMIAPTLARHVVHGMWFDFMQNFRQGLLRENQVVPAPGHVSHGIAAADQAHLGCFSDLLLKAGAKLHTDIQVLGLV